MNYKINLKNLLKPEPVFLCFILIVIIALLVNGLNSIREWSAEKGLYPTGGSWMTSEESEALHKYRLRCQLRTASMLYNLNPEKYKSKALDAISEANIYFPDYFERGDDIQEAFFDTGDSDYLEALVQLTSKYEADLKVNRMDLSELEYVTYYETEEELTNIGRSLLKELNESFIGTLNETVVGDKSYFESYILATGVEAYLCNVLANIENYDRSHEISLSQTSKFWKELTILQRTFNQFIEYYVPLSNRDYEGISRTLDVLHISLSDASDYESDSTNLEDGIYKKGEDGQFYEVAPSYLYYLDEDGEYQIMLDGNVPEGTQLYIQNENGEYVPYSGVDALTDVEERE